MLIDRRLTGDPPELESQSNHEGREPMIMRHAERIKGAVRTGLTAVVVLLICFPNWAEAASRLEPRESNELVKKLWPNPPDAETYRAAIEEGLRVPNWAPSDPSKSTTRWTGVSRAIVDPTTGVEHDKIGRIRCAAWAWHNGLGETTLWAGASSGGLHFLGRDPFIPSWRIWVPVSENLQGSPSVGAFLVRPGNSNQILIGTGDYGRWSDPGTGLYRTTNGGQTWTRIAMSPEPADFFTLMTDPDDSTGSRVYAATSEGVFISHDFGLTWDQAYAGSPTYGVTDIARANDNADWILGVPGVGVVRCSLLTSLYHICNNDTGVTDAVTRVSVAVTPSNTNWVYALASNGDTFTGIFRSSNGGSTFVNMDPNYSGDPIGWNQGQHTHAIAVDPASPDRVIAGMAATQMTLNATESNPADICWHRNVGVSPAGACDTTGLDAGHVDQTSMAFIPQSVDPGNTDVLITNDGGIYTYDWAADSHDDWFNEWGINVSQTYTPRTFDMSNTDPDLLLAGLQDNGLLKIDLSSTTETYRYLFGADGGSVSIHPSNPNQMAMANGLPYYRYFWQGAGPAVSMDVNLPYGWSTSMVYNHDENLPVVFTHDGRYLYWRWSWEGDSVDWRTVNPNHPLPSGINIQGVETAGVDPLVIYITDWNSSSNGTALYVMEEGVTGTLGDMNWEDRTPSGPFVPASPSGGWVFADRSSTHDEWVTFATGGHRPSRVFLSPNRGVNWWDVTGELEDILPNADYWQLLVHPMDQHQQFLATEVGVFRTDDGGNHWYRYMNGLPSVVKVRAMQIRSTGPDDTELFIATWGHGLWERSVEFNEGALFGDGFETGTTDRWDTVEDG